MPLTIDLDYIMKIQLDQNGKTIESRSDVTRASGILLSRKGKEMRVDIGNRASTSALFAAMGHLRSVTCRIFLASSKASLGPLIPLDTKLSASDACFHLAKLLLQQVEHRQEFYETNELCVLTQDMVPNLPVSLHSLCNLRMQRMDTAAALSMIDETEMTNTSFIMPSSEMAYVDFGYRVRKLPKEAVWPSYDTYLPLSFGQLLSPTYAPWYNSLAHIALCVRRPMLQRAQIRLSLPNAYRLASGDKASDTTKDRAYKGMTSLYQNEADILTAPVWHGITRILYPLAAQNEKPANFRLLMRTLVTKTGQNIL